MLTLPNPSQQYEAGNESRARSAIQEADARNMKIGATFDKIKMRDTVTGGIVTLTVASGSLVIT